MDDLRSTMYDFRLAIADCRMGWPIVLCFLLICGVGRTGFFWEGILEALLTFHEVSML